jgi:hypothetical protein
MDHRSESAPPASSVALRSLVQKILDQVDSPGVGASGCLGNVHVRQKRLCGNEGAKQGVGHFHEQFNQNKYHEIYPEATQVFRDAAPESEANAFFDRVHLKLGTRQWGAKVFCQCFHSRNIHPAHL